MKSTLQLGNIQITWLCGGDFELDGGTMYGAVPKVLWNKKYPADTTTSGCSMHPCSCRQEAAIS